MLISIVPALVHIPSRSVYMLASICCHFFLDGHPYLGEMESQCYCDFTVAFSSRRVGDGGGKAFCGSSSVPFNKQAI